MNHEQLLQRIHSKGYWRVVIRPASQFEQKQIPTLSEVRDVARSCVVCLRGWDYPYFKDGDLVNGVDWVECGIDWKAYVGYWRFYQSGQFVHHFAMREDYWDMNQMLPKRYPPWPQRSGYLSHIEVLYTVTEIFEFAARMAGKQVLRPAAVIEIELHGTVGRQLVSEDFSRWRLPDNFVCGLSKIPYEQTVSEAELLGDAATLALEATIYVYERFNWDKPDRSILAQDQKRFLERRL